MMEQLVSLPTAAFTTNWSTNRENSNELRIFPFFFNSNSHFNSIRLKAKCQFKQKKEDIEEKNYIILYII